MMNTLRDAFAAARQQLGKAAERRKDRYDLRVKPNKYAVGTWVWYLTLRRRPRLSPKWQDKYDGPYLVVKEAGPVNVAIQRSARSCMFYVHIDKLKPCYTPGLQSWIKPVPNAVTERHSEEHDRPTAPDDVIDSSETPSSIDDNTSEASDENEATANDIDTDRSRSNSGDDYSFNCPRRLNVQKPARYRQ